VASLEHDSASGQYRARFRFAGREYKRSLRTSEYKEAKALLGRIDYTVRLIERGELEIPISADPATFIVTAGKKTGESASSAGPLTLKQLFDTYTDKLPAGSKEESTLKTEKLHFKHLLRHLKAGTIAQSLTASHVQAYVQRRAKDKYRGRFTRPDTIKLELTTLRLVWNWAVGQGLLVGLSPVRGIKYPKADEKPPFMTMAEIERTIARGGLTNDDEAALWESLYLTKKEVDDVLDFVKANAKDEVAYPMFVFVAHTGARRSELLRARIDDFDFDSETVLIREKKKSKSKATTYRRIAMTGLLKSVMRRWFDDHPGGQFAIARAGENGPEALTTTVAHNMFKRTLAHSPLWSRINGFHVFRHSFVSNLAAASVDQRVIDEFVGHATEEQRRRYRHLFPDVRQRAIQVLDHSAA